MDFSLMRNPRRIEIRLYKCFKIMLWRLFLWTGVSDANIPEIYHDCYGLENFITFRSTASLNLTSFQQTLPELER